MEQCLRDKVELIATIGSGCEDLEEEIDWLIVADGESVERYITTSSHPGETLAGVLEFATHWNTKAQFRIEEVHL